MILTDAGPGGGPPLHRIPYDETWVVQEGNLLFRIGDALAEARQGDIVIARPRVPHKFTTRGRAGRD
jgi:mannose-6-phosphate isomerase-like protein (cupin superfamily)